MLQFRPICNNMCNVSSFRYCSMLQSKMRVRELSVLKFPPRTALINASGQRRGIVGGGEKEWLRERKRRGCGEEKIGARPRRADAGVGRVTSPAKWIFYMLLLWRSRIYEALLRVLEDVPLCRGPRRRSRPWPVASINPYATATAELRINLDCVK